MIDAGDLPGNGRLHVTDGIGTRGKNKQIFMCIWPLN
jgi:hypothetical protein